MTNDQIEHTGIKTERMCPHSVRRIFQSICIAMPVLLHVPSAMAREPDTGAPAMLTETRHQPVPQDRWLGSAGWDYSRGAYGQDTATTIQTFQATLGYRGDTASLSLNLPYLQWREPSAADADGVGDAVLRGRYYLTEEGHRFAQAPAMDLLARIKIPTADSDKGLGTGKPDYRFGVGFHKTLGRHLVMADIEYEIRGNPSGSSLDDRLLCALGAGRPVYGNISLFLFINGGTRNVPSSAAPLEISVFLNWNARPAFFVQGYAGVGLSEGSPDHFIGLTAGQRFGSRSP